MTQHDGGMRIVAWAVIGFVAVLAVAVAFAARELGL